MDLHFRYAGRAPSPSGKRQSISPDGGFSDLGIDHGENAIDECLAFLVGFESPFVFAKQEDGSSVVLPKKILANMPASCIFEFYAVDALDEFEVLSRKFDLHNMLRGSQAGIQTIHRL